MKQCEWCGTDFTPKTYHHKFCKKSCGVMDYQKRKGILNGEGQRDLHLQRHYGITLDEWNSLYNEQGGMCAVCEATESKGNKPLATDHDHETGEVRGLLCDDHNRALGLCNDDPDVLLRLAFYLLGNTQLRNDLNGTNTLER